MLIGIEVYSVQYMPLMRAVILLIMGIVLMENWKTFTSDRDIELLEQE